MQFWASSRFLLLAWIGLVALAAGCSRGGGNRQNVLLIVVDTVRADRLSVYGADRATTPFLAERSASAAVFDQAIAPTSWTLPSFGSLFTGRLMSRHNAGLSVEFRGGDVALARLDSTVWTLAEVLRGERYATAAFVNNPFLSPNLGLERGFDLYDYAHADNLTLRRADRMTDRVLDWFRHREDTPWFVTVHLFDPHMDYDPPEATRGHFTGGYDGRFSYPVSQLEALREGRMELDDADRAFIRGAYDEEILFVDRELKRLFEGLTAAGHLANTLVVLTSDHGEELFERGGFEHGHSLHQEVVRVPLLIWGPEVAAGRFSTPVSLTDVPLTILDALDLPVPEGCEGRTLWPAIAGPAELAPRPVVSEGVLYGAPRRALIEWPYKLMATKDLPTSELYRLDTDPAEKNDLAASKVSIADQMRGRLDALIREAARERVRSSLSSIPPDVRERLRALGYLD